MKLRKRLDLPMENKIKELRYAIVQSVPVMERAAGSRDLQYHDNDADSLTHISECQCQRIDQQGKCSCRKACRQEKQCRLHNIDLQQPQISKNNLWDTSSVGRALDF